MATRPGAFERPASKIILFVGPLLSPWATQEELAGTLGPKFKSASGIPTNIYGLLSFQCEIPIPVSTHCSKVSLRCDVQ